MRQITIQQNDAGQRLDKFLAKSMPALPKGLMCKFIRTKHIKRNGKRCAISDRLEPGDVLTFFISDDFSGACPTADSGLSQSPCEAGRGV